MFFLAFLLSLFCTSCSVWCPRTQYNIECRCQHDTPVAISRLYKSGFVAANTFYFFFCWLGCWDWLTGNRSCVHSFHILFSFRPIWSYFTCNIIKVLSLSLCWPVLHCFLVTPPPSFTSNSHQQTFSPDYILFTFLHFWWPRRNIYYIYNMYVECVILLGKQ